MNMENILEKKFVIESILLKNHKRNILSCYFRQIVCIFVSEKSIYLNNKVYAKTKY